MAILSSFSGLGFKMINKNRLTELENFDADRACFACGPDNPIGLHMTFYRNEKTVFSWLKVPRQLYGWQNILHGGIVSTILDEVMSWTAHHLIKKLILTRSITVDFLHPLYVETEIRAEGWISRLNSEREAILEAHLFNATEKICAKATGSFALLTPKVARRLGVLDESIIRRFEQFLE